MMTEMGSPASEEAPPEKHAGWVRRWFLPPVGLLLAAAITGTLFVFRDSVADLGNLGYLGAFLISLVANGTIILPMPGLLLLFALGATFHPVLIGVTAGAGGALGEITGYMAGYSGHGFWRNSQAYASATGWVRRWGSWIVFVFTATPLPVDVVGVAAGALRFPLWKFLLVCWVGKSILYSGMALAGAWGWDAVVSGDLDMTALWVGGAALAALLILGTALVLEDWSWKRGRRHSR